MAREFDVTLTANRRSDGNGRWWILYAYVAAVLVFAVLFVWIFAALDRRGVWHEKDTWMTGPRLKRLQASVDRLEAEVDHIERRLDGGRNTRRQAFRPEGTIPNFGAAADAAQRRGHETRANIQEFVPALPAVLTWSQSGLVGAVPSPDHRRRRLTTKRGRVRWPLGHGLDRRDPPSPALTGPN